MNQPPTKSVTPTRRAYAEALRALAHVLEKNENMSNNLVGEQMVMPANALIQLLVYWGYRFNAERGLWEAPPA